MVAAVVAFAGVAALLNIAPGLDTMVVLRSALAGGRRVGGAAAAGVLLGCLGWGVAAALGVTALLAASRLGYDVLRFAGAGYLAWLGVRTLLASRRSRYDETVPVPRIRTAGPGAFRSGLLTNLLNPKAGVFYLSLIPQFLPRGVDPAAGTLLLTAVDLGELTVWYAFVTVAAGLLAARLRRGPVRRRLDQLSGVTVLGFAAKLAVDRG